jgi:Flp pilus assembly protein TadG
MERKQHEKGQALILIALAAVGLFAFAALAIDGSRLYSDKRHAQNSADTAAMAAALAHGRGSDVTTAALERALSNGYDDNGTTNDVTVTVVDSPAGVCPANTEGKDITVDIVSTIDTTFARVLGRQTVTTAVTATSRTCGSYLGPPFDGNAIVALAPSGKGYDGTGTPNWYISGGGIFSNSSSSNAAYCNGAAEIHAPSVTVVGTTDLGCHVVDIPTSTPNAPAYSAAAIAGFLPRQPACNGIATQSGGQWSPQAGADGSRMPYFPDGGDFAPGIYCFSDDPAPISNAITGTGVMFYASHPNFSLKFAGNGASITASAQTSGEYAGILFYIAPQFDANGNLIQTQQLDLRGNGVGDVTGTIWAPSANVTMFGNSGTGAFNSQIIAYTVDSGGTANINISFNPNDNHTLALPIILTMLK